MNYQDTWIGGRAERSGARECGTRYSALCTLFGRYGRRFTMLDLGAAQGYFSVRAAEQYDCVAVMVDERDDGLLDICRRSQLDSLVFLDARLDLETLRMLGSCEHFDVVLAMNVLHHVDAPAAELVAAVCALGDNVVIETPPPGDINACGGERHAALHEAVGESCKHVMATTPSHVTHSVLRELRLGVQAKTRITRSYFDYPDGMPPADVAVASSYLHKEVSIPRKRERRPWVAGINLRTYQLLGGVWPPTEMVAEWIEETPITTPHGDVRPWNFILDGSQVVLIDGGDDRAPHERPDADDRLDAAEQIRSGIARSALIVLLFLLAGCLAVWHRGGIDYLPLEEETSVDISYHGDCYRLAHEVVAAQLDAVTPGGLSALSPGVSVALWPAGGSSRPEIGLIVADCALSGLEEGAAAVLKARGVLP